MCINIPQELISKYMDETPKETAETVRYHENTYQIVSRVGYLLGIPEKYFDEENRLDIDIYRNLSGNRNARIIRNLCMLRTGIIRNNKEIYNRIKFDLQNLGTMPDLIPQECIVSLESDGISILQANVLPNQYILSLNRHISDRINNCKSIFPTWIHWDYIRELFIMTGGTTENGIKSAVSYYYGHMNAMPFRVYCNWPSSKEENILYHDKRFCTALYEAHEDRFTDLSKVSNIGLKEKNSIYDFLQNSDGTALVVDCENSDPYKLYAMLNNLDTEALLGKIRKIVLYNDVHTASAWKILDRFTDIPVEEVNIERLKDNKSLADVMLTAGTCREYYVNGTKSFMLASSDSDFWGLITSLPEAEFLVLVESRKCGPDIKMALENRGFAYCYLDNFCTGNSDEIKIEALKQEIMSQLDEYCCFNIYKIVEEAFTITRADMTDKEKKQFFDRYIKPMKLVIHKDGEVYIELGN